MSRRLAAATLAVLCAAPVRAQPVPQPAEGAEGSAAEVAKTLPLVAPTAWAERIEQLDALVRSRTEQWQRRPRPYVRNQTWTGPSTADSQLLLEAELALLAREMAVRLQQAPGNPVWDGATRLHSVQLLPGPNYDRSARGSFLAVMLLMCEDLPPYDQSGKNLRAWPVEADLAATIRRRCRELTHQEGISRGALQRRDQADNYQLAPELEAAMLRDVEMYAALCAEGRWQQAQAIGDSYWSALHTALVDGTVVLPAFGASAVAAPAATADGPTAADVLAWIERERMAVEQARGSAPADEYHVWQNTRARYDAFLVALGQRLAAEQQSLAKARHEADEFERAGLADAARDLRERIARQERQPVVDVGTEVRQFALQGAVQSQWLMQSVAFYLLDLEQPSAQVAPFFASLDRTIPQLRETIVRARHAAAELGKQGGPADNVTALRGQEGHAAMLIADLERILAAHRAGDAAAMRAVVEPRRRALRGADSVPTLIVEAPSSSAAPAAQYRTCEIDLARARTNFDQAQQRLQATTKSMKRRRGAYPSAAEHLALWRVRTAAAYHRAVRDHLQQRERESGSALPVTWRVVDLPDGGAEYSFARFDPAMLSSADGLKACRDRWQARLATTQKQIEELARVAMPAAREELAACRDLEAELARALDLLARGEHGQLTQFLDGVWARVVAP